MPSDAQLLRLAQRVGRRLLHTQRRLATAESCTAGWIAKALTDVAGSSRWFECGWVVYADAAKRRDLGVSAAALARHGAVSESVARQMVRGALVRAGVDVAVAVTGIAGPDGGSPAKPVGTVWFAVALRRGRRLEIAATRARFGGNREQVRRKSVSRALKLVLALAPG